VPTVVIPARDESQRVGDTVRAAATLPGVSRVIVVDDGSRDDTTGVAEAAGATVLRHHRARGKAAALETGARAAGSGLLLFLDADLGATAANAGPLITPVSAGSADMTIAAFATIVKLGGHGIVVRTARSGIKRATGWTATQPLNGQRCLTWEAFTAARPLAPGFGAETGMTIDLLRKGFRITEVEVDMAHRATGGDLAAQLHRARQELDVLRALATRGALTSKNLRFVIAIVPCVSSHVLAVIGVVGGIAGVCLGVVGYLRSVRAVRECSALVQGSVGSHGTVDPRALRDVAIVRYDALNEMSGQLSFSMALLNALGDGVVLSSINGRQETRTYAKVVQSGKGAQDLSPEEQQAIKSARLGQAQPQRDKPSMVTARLASARDVVSMPQPSTD
jgi:hypothetical protein